MRGGLGKKQLTLFPPPSTNFFQKTEVEESNTLTDNARSFVISRRLAGIRWHGIPLRGQRWWTGSGVS